MNKVKTFIVLFIILVLIGGALFLSVLFNKIPENPPGTVGNTGGNHYNSGLFCENEGQVFFANPYDQNTLYVMNSDETNVKKLTTVGVKFINVAGKYVYYYQDDVGAGSGLGYTIKTTGIHRMEKNGRKSECLIKVPLLSMNLINNNIYFQHFTDEGLTLDTISIDKSTTSTALVGIVPTASVSNNIIYYSDQEDNFYLYAFDTVTGSKSLVWNHKVYNPIYHIDGYIYYMDVENNYHLHRYNPATGENQSLTSDRVDNFNVYGSYIYYQKASEIEPALKRMQTDGSYAEVVVYGIFNNINMTSNYVYFTEFGSTSTLYHQYIAGPVNPTIFMPQVEE